MENDPKKAFAVRLVVSLAVIGVFGLAGLTMSGAAARDARRTKEEAFWNALRIQGSEVEDFKTIVDMATAADLVVFGHLSNFRMSRQIQGDADEDVVTYAVADVTVEKTVRGRPPSSPIALEFLLSQAPIEVPGLVDAQRARIPAGRALFFLRQKRGPGESGFYRLVNMSGLWVEGHQGFRTPLTEPIYREPRPPLSIVESLREYEEDRATALRLRGESTVVEGSGNATEEAESAPAYHAPEMEDLSDVEVVGAPRYAAELSGTHSLEELGTLVGEAR
jgi:hypothetical protein